VILQTALIWLERCILNLECAVLAPGSSWVAIPEDATHNTMFPLAGRSLHKQLQRKVILVPGGPCRKNSVHDPSQCGSCSYLSTAATISSKLTTCSSFNCCLIIPAHISLLLHLITHLFSNQYIAYCLSLHIPPI